MSNLYKITEFLLSYLKFSTVTLFSKYPSVHVQILKEIHLTFIPLKKFEITDLHIIY